MTNQNIIQEIIDGYLAKAQELKPEQNGNVPYDEIPKLTIVTAFWFMRITGKHYASLRKRDYPQISTRPIEDAVAAIQKEIYNYFFDIFSNDFEYYSLFMIDNAYKNFDAMESEWKNISDEPKVHKDFAKNIDFFMKRIADLRKSIPPVERKYHFRLLKKYEKGIPPSDLIKVDYCSKQIRNSPLFYRQPPKPQDENTEDRKEPFWNRFKNEINPLANSVVNIQKMITNLFHHSDDCLKEAMSLCNEKTMPNFTKFLYNLRYPASVHFNLEAALIFMFLDIKMQDGIFSCLIRKYEAFFNNLYESLRKDYAMIDTILFPQALVEKEEMLEGFIGPPLDVPDLKNNLSFFHLKKLIALQQLYMDVSHSSLPQAEDDLMKRFDMIITYTKMPYIAYNPVLHNLPEYIMEILSINQSDLRNILDVNKSTISRQRNSNKLIENNKWFWVAAAGYTYEFLNGETTIPMYGKPPEMYENRYLIFPAITMAHGELFLKRVASLKDYRVRLASQKGKKGISIDEEWRRQNNLLSRKHLQKISRESYIFANHIRNCRDYIDRLCQRERSEVVNESRENYDTNISDSKTKTKRSTIYSERATEKLIFYFRIFERMLDALQDNHIAELQTSLKDEKNIHILNLIEEIMDSLSILTLKSSKYIESNNSKDLEAFKKQSILVQRQITVLKNSFVEILEM